MVHQRHTDVCIILYSDNFQLSSLTFMTFSVKATLFYYIYIFFDCIITPLLRERNSRKMCAQRWWFFFLFYTKRTNKLPWWFTLDFKNVHFSHGCSETFRKRVLLRVQTWIKKSFFLEKTFKSGESIRSVACICPSIDWIPVAGPTRLLEAEQFRVILRKLTCPLILY